MNNSNNNKEDGPFVVFEFTSCRSSKHCCRVLQANGRKRNVFFDFVVVLFGSPSWLLHASSTLLYQVPLHQPVVDYY